MKKVIFILMTIFFASMLVYSIVHIVFWFKDNKHINDLTNEIYKDAYDYTITVEKDDKNDKTSETKNTIVEKTINLELLKKKNSDTKGWIEVKGTNINYPFVQSKDNKYYLTHSFDKKYTDAGWVFLDYRNNIDELDKNTVIYGHARKDKSMFGTLKYTLDKSWYNKKSNQIIKVTTDKYNLEFQVFSTYHIKTEDYYIQTSFENDEAFKSFLDKIKKRSTYRYNVDLNEKDYILTLSTCYNNEQKVVLHAKLIKKEIK